MLKIPAAEGLLLAVFSLVCLPVYGETPNPKKPNFIFVLSDDIAQGDLGCYGQKLIKTPRIDQMAAEGTRYL